MDEKMRAWAEISLDALKHNIRTVRSVLPEGCKLVGTVKADAYGHGAYRIAEWYNDLGIDYLTVATCGEGVQLRSQGVKAPILILGYTPLSAVEEITKNDLTQTVTSLDYAKQLNGALGGGKLKVHIKIDTGMNRLGIHCGEDAAPAVEEVCGILALKNLLAEGIYTHFSTSEAEFDAGNTEAQFKRFTNLVQSAEERSGWAFVIKHCANTGAVFHHPHTALDMVRPGIALYGYGDPLGRLRPVMTLKSRIVQIKPLSPGEAVSYGRMYTAGRPERIAVVSIGYADGLMRSASGRFTATVRGRPAPQRGSICMDMCMVDISGIDDAQVGDEVTIFGRGGIENAESLAAKAGTISYELLCAVSQRVPRIYL